MKDRLRKSADRAALLALVCGVLFFLWLIGKVDTDKFVSLIRESGGWVVGIGVVYGLFQAAYCLGWKAAIPSKKIGFPRLFMVYLAGDTANYALPLTGEPLLFTA